MENNHEKKALRKLLLERRDTTSYDLMQIASKSIAKKIKKILSFKNAQKIGAYYPIKSEILTQDIIQHCFSEGKQVFLPKIKGDEIEFRQIVDINSLDSGKFGIMEPRDNCPVNNNVDVILVPTVGITLKGVRLGYGFGFYDRFLKKNNIPSISLTLEKQILKKIPFSEYDAIIDWIVTEDRVIQTLKG